MGLLSKEELANGEIQTGQNQTGANPKKGEGVKAGQTTSNRFITFKSNPENTT